MGWLRFFSSWDARAWRAVGATLALFLAVAGVLLLGKSALGADAVTGVEHWLERARGSGLGLPATVLAFTVAAFIGVPQFLLIAAAVLAFGPVAGFAYSWISTVVSAAVTFWVGRLIGARSLERFGGGALQRISRFVGRNAFVGSMVIRNVPSAPFIVVNMAFGVSAARFWSFLAGCAVGVLPKTALVALFGTSIRTAVVGDGVWSSLIVAGVAVVGLIGMLWARRLLQRRAERAEATGD